MNRALSKNQLKLSEVLLLMIFVMIKPVEAAIIEGRDYTISPALKRISEDSGKIDVVEFFSYSCSHCAELHPFIERWENSVDKSKVDVNYIHVLFRKDFETWVKLDYAIQHGKFHKLKKASYDAISREKIDLSDESIRADWLRKNEVDVDKFEKLYSSFAANNAVVRNRNLTTEFNIRSTPTIVINGRYVVSPAPPERLVQVVDEIIKAILDKNLN